MPVTPVQHNTANTFPSAGLPAAFKAGDIVSADILSKEQDKTVLKLANGFQFETTEPIHGNPGDTIKLEVIPTDRNSVAFKQVMDHIHQKHEESIEESIDIEPAVLALRGKSFAMAKALMEAQVEDQKKIAAALAKIQKQIESSVSSGQSPALSSLLAQGVSLKKITLDIMSQLVGSSPKAAAAQLTTEELKSAVEELSLQASKEKTESIAAKVGALMQAKLPLTKRNFDALSSVVNKAEKIASLPHNSSMLVSLIRKNTAPTVENFYRSLYSGEKDVSAQYPNKSWQSLEKSVSDFLTRIGLEANSENLTACRFLIANDLPVNENHIDLYRKSQAMHENINFQEIVLNAAQRLKAKAGESEVPLFSAVKKEYNPETLLLNYKELIKDMTHFNDSTINSVKDCQQPMTLGNLQLAQSGLLQQSAATPTTVYEPIDQYRRNLFEISFRLTTEAALRLSAGGIRIDNLPLSRSLEMLKQTQELINKDSLAFANVRMTQENVSTLNEIVDKVRSIVPTPATIGGLMNKSVPFSINGVYYSDKRTMAANAYEFSATKVHGRFGDTFSKVAGQVEGLLKALKIEQSTDNIRAASALIKNDMDVTPDSLLNARSIADKIDYITNKLHPFVAARMIRDGFNPLNADIDDVIDFMKSFEKEYGESSKEKVSRYIYEMDKKHEFTNEERKSVISIYRMLSSIDKTEGWVTGFAAKNNLPLTLESLMEASKYYSRFNDGRGFSAEADEKLAPLQNFVPGQEAEQTEKSKSIVDRLLDKFTDHANPETLNKAIKQEKIEALHLERSTELLQKINAENPPAAYEAPDTGFLQNMNPLVPLYLGSSKVAASLSNMKALSGFSKNEFDLGKNVEKLESSLKNKKPLSSVMSPSLTQLKQAGSPVSFLKELVSDLDTLTQSEEEKISEIHNLKELIADAAALQQELLEGGANFYKVPVRINGQVSTMNFYVLSDDAATKDQLTVALSLDTKNLGNISCKIELKKDSASLEIQCEDSISAAYLSYNQPLFISLAEAAGIHVEKVTFREQEYSNHFSEYVLPEPPQNQKSSGRGIHDDGNSVDIMA